MIICPKCKKEIEYLKFTCKTEEFGNFKLDNEGEPEFNAKDYGWTVSIK